MRAVYMNTFMLFDMFSVAAQILFNPIYKYS